MKTEIRANRTPWQDVIELAIIKRNTNGNIAIAEPLIMRTLDKSEIIQPTLSLRIDEAQIMIDELWRVGLRPSEGTGSAGSLAATERHLKDMQTITMKILEAHSFKVGSDL